MRQSITTQHHWPLRVRNITFSRTISEDFPHAHNLVLIGQPPLLQSLALTVNEEIRSRVTYSVILPRLGPDATEAFILAQLDRAGLGHNTFSSGRD